MTSPQLRSFWFLLLGFASGCLFTIALLGRYSIATAGAGNMGYIHLYRLDHLSGEVIGIGGQAISADSLPAWSRTIPTPADNPYLQVK